MQLDFCCLSNATGIKTSVLVCKTLHISAALAFLVSSASAATFTVSNVADAGPGSLRQAIVDANGNASDDTVVFVLPGAGPHVIELVSALPVLSTNVQILNDRTGDEAVTVRRSANAFEFGIFVAGPGSNVTLAGITVANGDIDDTADIREGAAVRNDHGTITVRRCTFSGNRGSSGGAIYNDGRASGTATLHISDSILTENSAKTGGGVYNAGAAIYNDAGGGGSAFLNVTDSLINRNTGGGVSTRADNSGFAKAMLTRCTVSENVGGALISYGSGTGEAVLEVQDCTIAGNSAGGGAGINVGSTGPSGIGRATAHNTTITGNHAFGAGGAGGGGVSSDNGMLTLTNCTLVNNTAQTNGGGINKFSGVANITNCTFSGNSAASGNGGAINNFASGKLTVTNCTFSANHGIGLRNEFAQLETGNTIYRRAAGGENITNRSGTVTSHGSNLSDDAAGGDESTGPGGLLNAAGDIRNTDPRVAELASNGGRTATHALLPDSPAINAGNDGNAPVRDQRDYVRSGVSDIGAFEFGGVKASTLANIATRMQVQTGENVLIGGFIITGTEQKKLMLRAVGPSLDLSGRLENPTLEIVDSSNEQVAFNDNWNDAPNRQEMIDSQVAPAHNLESAILVQLAPGPYTAVMRGAADTSGIGVVEVYDLERSANAELANIATRGFVQTAEKVMIGGFIMVGPNAQRVLIRAIGPSLPLSGSLADPLLELFDGNGSALRANDNWRENQEAEIIATSIAPSHEREAAILETLAPGAYTAVVRGVNAATGVAVVEVYALD